jgi:hypothetical protein
MIRRLHVLPLAGLMMILLGSAFVLSQPAPARAQSQIAPLPDRDRRDGPPRTLNTPRDFPQAGSRAEWEQRARDIRQRVLVSCGLWPLPEKPPLNAAVFDTLDRDGYSVSKVHFQSFPGFHVAGNLYRPLGRGPGPFPAVLNPHGHWNNGRFEDTETGSIAARCIQFARLGMVAFSIDMVGYGDTLQAGPHREFAAAPANLLWNISLMGLQTWNAIRGLDFLESLPDVGCIHQ